MSDTALAAGDITGIETMSVAELAVLPAATLVSLRAGVGGILEDAQRLDDKLDAALDYRYGPRARQLRAAQEKDTGTVRFEDNGFIVIAELPKRVKWDQQRLKELVELIRSGWGEDPSDYVKVRFEVSERAYESWPARLKELFAPARSVETGRPGYEIVAFAGGRRA
jgi:hypothetical protein